METPHVKLSKAKRPVKKIPAKGFRLTVAADLFLFALTLVMAMAAVAAFTATLVLATSIALIVLIISSCLLTILCFRQTYHLLRPHLPPLATRIADITRAQAADIFSAVTLGCFMVRDLEKKNPKIVPIDCKSPILLVHGYLGHSSNWTYMRHRLEEAGLGPVFTLNLGSVFQSIDKDYAPKVKQKADEIAKITGKKDLILIGHSMGGIISTYYAINMAPKGSVTAVITLGSPLNGTDFAIMEIGECARQMSSSSEFTKKLLEKIYESEQTHFYNLASEADAFIIPNSSALLDKSRMKSKLETHTFHDLGHISYLLSDRVADKLVEYVQFYVLKVDL